VGVQQLRHSVWIAVKLQQAHTTHRFNQSHYAGVHRLFLRVGRVVAISNTVQPTWSDTQCHNTVMCSAHASAKTLPSSVWMHHTCSHICGHMHTECLQQEYHQQAHSHAHVHPRVRTRTQTTYERTRVCTPGTEGWVRETCHTGKESSMCRANIVSSMSMYSLRGTGQPCAASPATTARPSRAKCARMSTRARSPSCSNTSTRS
jgi:hypothetical protein